VNAALLALGVPLVAAALAALLLTPLVIRGATVWGLLDAPAQRRVHKHPVPRVGGVAVFLATIFGLALALLLGGREGMPADFANNGSSAFFIGLMLGGGILFLAGLYDDVWSLSPSTKLVVQLLAAFIVFHFGFRIEILGWGAAEYHLGWLALPVTLMWVVGVTNAFNLIDGLDGLATGVALVAFKTTVAVALVLGRWEVAAVCLALIGALLGFLRYNFSPARIFLGDSGSLFIGFMLAVLSVYGSIKSTTAVLVAVPLFALAIPLLDTGLAMARRWLRGVPMSSADAHHIHHRLLALGLTHRRSVLILYVVAACIAVLGVSLAFAPPALSVWIGLAGGVACLLLFLVGMRSLRYHEFLEAGGALMSAVRKSRRVIRDRIHARDLAEVVRNAERLEEVAAVLEDNATEFGFLEMELCRESFPSRHQHTQSGGPRRAWKLDYPISDTSDEDNDPFVLRVWCPAGEGFRPYGAERVASILAPAIEQWLQRVGRAQDVSELTPRRRVLSIEV
jgi:UDP-GlcNAc:undecaprenyl-phosphate/decaprenyl-phosphate GlcNAc-1-phosphate transferase